MAREHDPNATAAHRSMIARYWPIGLILLAMGAFYLSGAYELFTLEAIIRKQDELAAAVEANWLTAAGSYLAIYVVMVALSFPGAALITVVGGVLFGVVAGTILTVVAATCGASIVFLAARTSFGAALRKRAGRFGERLADGFEENAFSYLFLLRLVPLFPFWLINVAPALFDVRLRTFVTATLLGIIPGTLAYTLLGSGLGDLVVALEEADPGCADAGTCEISLTALLTPGPIIAMAALTIIAIIPIGLKRWRARRGRAQEGAA